MAVERQAVERRGVYTVAEVAAALRVSSETIRRKIANRELRAVEVSSGPRRQYRLLARDLAAWLGPDTASTVFGVGAGLDSLERAFAPLAPEAREALLEEAKSWTRERTPERELAGRTASPQEIARRFRHPG